LTREEFEEIRYIAVTKIWEIAITSRVDNQDSSQEYINILQYFWHLVY